MVVTVNHGSPVRTMYREYEGGGSMMRLEHEDDNEGHDQLQPGEQCACGRIGLGLTRRDHE